jgi:hypothetical protein
MPPSNAVAQLRRRLALKVRVLNDGILAAAPSTDVVLSAGNLVPADCRVIEVGDLPVSEAEPDGRALSRREITPRRGAAHELVSATGHDTALRVGHCGTTALHAA